MRAKHNTVIPQWVFTEDLTHNELAVYIGLCTHADALGYATATHAQLSSTMRIPPRQVRYSMGHLIRKGLVSPTTKQSTYLLAGYTIQPRPFKENK